MPALTNINLQEAYRFWINTGLHWRDFFIGLDVPISMQVRALGAEWLACLKQDIAETPTDCVPPMWVQTATAKPTGETKAGDIKADRFRLEPPAEMPAVLSEFGDETRDGGDVPFRALEEADRYKITQAVLAARMRQAGSDWRPAEAAKMYIKRLLARAFRAMDQHGQMIFSPTDMRAISGALLDLQKAQRLALGLSSENLGFPINQSDNGGSQLPQIVVRITDKPLPKEDGDVIDAT